MLKVLLTLLVLASCQMAPAAGTYVKGPALIEGQTLTATAAGTTILTKDSQTNQIFTGSTTQTVQLPAANTLPLGRYFNVVNRSTGIITVNDGAAALLTTVSAGMTRKFLAYDIGSIAGGWNANTGILAVTGGGTGTDTAFTAGSVVFAGTSGVYTQDNASLFYDDTNNRLGVGTASPDSKLTVVETLASNPRSITSYQYSNNAAGSLLSFAKSRGTTASPATIVNGDFAGNIASRFYDGTSYLTTGSMAFRANGTVATGSIPTDFIIATGSTNDNSFTNERLRITSAGLLGVGTSAPSGQLHVAATTPSYFDRAGSNPSHLILRTARGTLAAPTATTLNTELGQVSFGGYDGTQWVNPLTGFTARAAELWTTIAQGTDFYIRTTAIGTTSAVERMRITSAGNVGIGISVPLAKLHVESTAASAASAALHLTNNSDTIGAETQIRLTPASASATRYNTIGAVRVNSAVSNLYDTVFRVTADTTPAEAMRLTYTSLLGIGIAAPVAKIHQDSGTAIATSHKLTAGTTTGQTATDGFDIGISATGSAEIRQRENLNLTMYTNNTQRMQIDSGGTVSIGGSAPANSAALDIQSTVGGLLIPRMTTAQKNGLTPSAGMMVYDTTLTRFECYVTAWDACATTQPAFVVSASISGANPTLGTAAVTSYTEVTDASLTVTPAANSTAVGAICSGTNANTTPSTSPTTCAAGSESVGIAVTIPSTGWYEFCFDFSHNFNLGTVADTMVNATFQVIETPTNAQTLTQEAGTRVTSGASIGVIQTNQQTNQNVATTCGMLYFSTTGVKGIRLMYEQGVTNTPNSSSLLADLSSTGGQRQIYVRGKKVP